MMKVYTIYVATNTVNGKKYIGFDSAWPRRRRAHLTSAFTQSNKQYKQRFHAAIRKYGKEAFLWGVLYQSLDGKHTLNVMERHFIAEYKTFIGFEDCNGYNLTLGGEGQLGRLMSDETKLKKSQALKGRPNRDSKVVHTPFGVFDGVYMAASALELHPRTILERIKRATFPDWYYVNTVIDQIYNPRTGQSREIVTPHGVFSSTKRCSEQTSIPISTIQTRLESPLQSDWYYTGKTQYAHTRSIVTPSGTFTSITEAARVLGLTVSTIAARIRSKRNKQWFYTDEPK